jgi:hypothetical protein
MFPKPVFCPAIACTAVFPAKEVSFVKNRGITVLLPHLISRLFFDKNDYSFVKLSAKAYFRSRKSSYYYFYARKKKDQTRCLYNPE